MKHFKKHIKRLHRIKVHHNRWFIWAIAVIVISCLTLVSYIDISQRFTDYSMVDPSFLTTRGVLYRDSFSGFSLRHPEQWGVEAESRDQIAFNDPYNFGEGVTVGVYDLSDEIVIRRSLDILEETEVTVAGELAAYMVVKNDDSATEKVVIVSYQDRLFVVRGITPWFDYIVGTFYFIPAARS